MAKTQPRTTTPEEEGIELHPDAMERLERAIKTAARHGPIPAGTIKAKPKKTAIRHR
jgi:predicted ATPase